MYAYEGEMINGKPGGNGTIKYGEKKDVYSKTYSCTYTGTFLNGMKHGTGKLEVKGNVVGACIYDQRYTYDKKDGIFVIKYDRGSVFTQVYLDDKRHHVRKDVSSDGKNHEYYDMKDDLLHGNEVNYLIDDKIWTCKYVEGKVQYGTGVTWKKK